MRCGRTKTRLSTLVFNTLPSYSHTYTIRHKCFGAFFLTIYTSELSKLFIE